MRRPYRAVAARCMICLCMGLCCLIAGCEDKDDAKAGRGHVPPEGMGAILIENQLRDIRLTLAVNGVIEGRVSSYDFLAVDYLPGVYEVHLDYNNSSREYDTVVAVVADSNTVINITGSSDDGRADVDTYILAPE